MIFKNLANRIQNEKTYTLPELVEMLNPTVAGQTVTPERSHNVATAYRCINVLSDDVAKLPLQIFSTKTPGKIEHISPNSRSQNLAWLLEKKPNKKMVPFIFKKTIIRWLVCWGNAYVWKPLTRGYEDQQLHILRSEVTYPVFDRAGNIWFRTMFDNQEEAFIPYAEIFHLMLNSKDGITGRSVIEYARESIGRQLGAYNTENNIIGAGLNPSAILWTAGDMTDEARKKVKETYLNSASEGVLVIDKKIEKFEAITMKPTDAQFLETMADNDVQIANFFGMPLYKINKGKEAYNSNEQQNLDYLNTTLDPYLVQFEQEATAKWLTSEEQEHSYTKFNRDALLRTDAKSRSEVIEKRIQSGVLTPNEGRQIEDLSSFEGGDAHYFPSNMAVIAGDGKLETAGNVTQLNIGK